MSENNQALNPNDHQMQWTALANRTATSQSAESQKFAVEILNGTLPMAGQEALPVNLDKSVMTVVKQRLETSLVSETLSVVLKPGNLPKRPIFTEDEGLPGQIIFGRDGKPLQDPDSNPRLGDDADIENELRADRREQAIKNEVQGEKKRSLVRALGKGFIFSQIPIFRQLEKKRQQAEEFGTYSAEGNSFWSRFRNATGLYLANDFKWKGDYEILENDSPEIKLRKETLRADAMNSIGLKYKGGDSLTLGGIVKAFKTDGGEILKTGMMTGFNVANIMSIGLRSVGAAKDLSAVLSNARYINGFQRPLFSLLGRMHDLKLWAFEKDPIKRELLKKKFRANMILAALGMGSGLVTNYLGLKVGEGIVKNILESSEDVGAKEMLTSTIAQAGGQMIVNVVGNGIFSFGASKYIETLGLSKKESNEVNSTALNSFGAGAAIAALGQTFRVWDVKNIQELARDRSDSLNELKQIAAGAKRDPITGRIILEQDVKLNQAGGGKLYSNGSIKDNNIVNPQTLPSNRTQVLPVNSNVKTPTLQSGGHGGGSEIPDLPPAAPKTQVVTSNQFDTNSLQSWVNKAGTSGAGHNERVMALNVANGFLKDMGTTDQQHTDFLNKYAGVIATNNINMNDPDQKGKLALYLASRAIQLDYAKVKAGNGDAAYLISQLQDNKNQARIGKTIFNLNDVPYKPSVDNGQNMFTTVQETIVVSGDNGGGIGGGVDFSGGEYQPINGQTSLLGLPADRDVLAVIGIGAAALLGAIALGEIGQARNLNNQLVQLNQAAGAAIQNLQGQLAAAKAAKPPPTIPQGNNGNTPPGQGPALVQVPVATPQAAPVITNNQGAGSTSTIPVAGPSANQNVIGGGIGAGAVPIMNNGNNNVFNINQGAIKPLPAAQRIAALPEDFDEPTPEPLAASEEVLESQSLDELQRIKPITDGRRVVQAQPQDIQPPANRASPQSQPIIRTPTPPTPVQRVNSGTNQVANNVNPQPRNETKNKGNSSSNQKAKAPAGNSKFFKDANDGLIDFERRMTNVEEGEGSSYVYNHLRVLDKAIDNIELAFVNGADVNEIEKMVVRVKEGMNNANNRVGTSVNDLSDDDTRKENYLKVKQKVENLDKILEIKEKDNGMNQDSNWMNKINPEDENINPENSWNDLGGKLGMNSADELDPIFDDLNLGINTINDLDVVDNLSRQSLDDLNDKLGNMRPEDLTEEQRNQLNLVKNYANRRDQTLRQEALDEVFKELNNPNDLLDENLIRTLMRIYEENYTRLDQSRQLQYANLQALLDNALVDINKINAERIQFAINNYSNSIQRARDLLSEDTLDPSVFDDINNAIQQSLNILGNFNVANYNFAVEEAGDISRKLREKLDRAALSSNGIVIPGSREPENPNDIGSNVPLPPSNVNRQTPQFDMAQVAIMIQDFEKDRTSFLDQLNRSLFGKSFYRSRIKEYDATYPTGSSGNPRLDEFIKAVRGVV